MTLPKGARFEADLGEGVALYDVSHLLPIAKPDKRRKRSPSKIERIYVHKSGGVGRDGFEGLVGSTRYVVSKRGFPGCAYTFWVPLRPDKDELHRRVVYRGVADDVRSWHTGRAANDHGVALCLQGNPSKARPPWAQRHCAERLLDWALGAYPLDDRVPISTHSDSKRFGSRKDKSVCPGAHAEKWLATYLRDRGLTK